MLGFPEERKTPEQALGTVIQEAWISGVSTRRVDDPVRAMGLSGISKSTVSKPCKEIDERVGEFLNRPLTRDWPYVWLDATYLKQRQGGPIVPVAAIIAVAANTEGRREIIGPGIGPSQAGTFWTDLPALLEGPRPRWGEAGDQRRSHRSERCHRARLRSDLATRRVHWMRNALAHVSRGPHRVAAAAIRQAFEQPDRKHAGETWRHVAERLRTRWPKLADLMDASEHDVLAYMAFPRQAPHHVAQREPDRAPEQRGEASRRCRRDLSERGVHHASHRCRALRTERRLADPRSLHAGRGLRPD